MSSPKPGVPKLLDTAKYTFLGLYFFMEMFTITDVMGLTRLESGPWVVIESNRFWFYALMCSMLSAVWEGLFAGEKQQRLVAEKEKKKGRKESAEKRVVSSGPKRGLPYKQLVIDGCDLFIPGAVVGWMPFSPLTVGVAMAISTLLQLGDMWPRIQAQTAAAAAAAASVQKKQ
jgi:hypothetical protein